MCEICKCARTAFDSYNDNNLALFLVNPQFKNDELIIIHYRGKSLEFAIAKAFRSPFYRAYCTTS